MSVSLSSLSASKKESVPLTSWKHVEAMGTRRRLTGRQKKQQELGSRCTCSEPEPFSVLSCVFPLVLVSQSPSRV